MLDVAYRGSHSDFNLIFRLCCALQNATNFFDEEHHLPVTNNVLVGDSDDRDLFKTLWLQATGLASVDKELDIEDNHTVIDESALKMLNNQPKSFLRTFKKLQKEILGDNNEIAAAHPEPPTQNNEDNASDDFFGNENDENNDDDDMEVENSESEDTTDGEVHSLLNRPAVEGVGEPDRSMYDEEHQDVEGTVAVNEQDQIVDVQPKSPEKNYAEEEEEVYEPTTSFQASPNPTQFWLNKMKRTPVKKAPSPKKKSPKYRTRTQDGTQKAKYNSQSVYQQYD